MTFENHEIVFLKTLLNKANYVAGRGYLGLGRDERKKQEVLLANMIIDFKKILAEKELKNNI